MRRQKKSFGVTLYDEESDDIAKEEEFVNAFISISSNNEEGSSYQSNGELNCQASTNLSYSKMVLQWKEETTTRAIQKEKIQSLMEEKSSLMEENQRLLMIISSLKLNLKEVQMEHEQLEKSVKMLNSSTGCLD